MKTDLLLYKWHIQPVLSMYIDVYFDEVFLILNYVEPRHIYVVISAPISIDSITGFFVKSLVFV